MCSGTSHDSTSYGGVKNEKTVWRKRIRVTQYIYVYTGIYWVFQGICLVFAKAGTPKYCHAFKLFSIVYNCTATPPKHSTLYIYVYTGIYWVYPGIHLVFAKARTPKYCHPFKLFSIVYNCAATPPKHSTLYFGAKSEKKIRADHEYLQPLIILICTRTYS